MVDQSGLHCFNNYILPLRDVEIHATRVKGLSVLTVRGIRTLFKDNQPVETVLLGKSLENFLTYLEKTVRSVKSNNNIYTVLIQKKPSRFSILQPFFVKVDVNFVKKLSCHNIFFFDIFL